MDSTFYQEKILRDTLVPYIRDQFPFSHRLMQDNDPKHVSRATQAFMEEIGINWWITPPESPDLNPIENVWNELKVHLRKKVKPSTKAELIYGITNFWANLTAERCERYINHVRTVQPVVLLKWGAASGF